MLNFQDTFETRKRSFISAFSICMTVPLVQKPNSETIPEFLSQAYEKQPLQVLCKNRCSGKFRKFHKKILVSESLFNKVTSHQACSFTKKRLQHRCFPVKFSKFLRLPILKNVCERMLLAYLGTISLSLSIPDKDLHRRWLTEP